MVAGGSLSVVGIRSGHPTAIGAGARKQLLFSRISTTTLRSSAQAQNAYWPGGIVLGTLTAVFREISCPGARLGMPTVPDRRVGDPVAGTREKRVSDDRERTAPTFLVELPTRKDSPGRAPVGTPVSAVTTRSATAVNEVTVFEG